MPRSGLISIEQNAAMKLFSWAAVVFLPPTLIAGIYGMNFDFFPELKWHYGYFIALGLMLASAILPYLYFRWRRLDLSRRGGAFAGLLARLLRPRRSTRRDAIRATDTKDPHDPDRPGQPQTRSTLEVGGKTYAYYSLAKAAETLGDVVAPALFDEGPARKSAALRGRGDGHPRRPPGDGRLAEGAAHQPRDPVPPGARADAGFHRRARGGRPRRDARRDEEPRRRPAEDQSAGPGPPGHRP